MIKLAAGKMHIRLFHIWRLTLPMSSKSIYLFLTSARCNTFTKDLEFLKGIGLS